VTGALAVGFASSAWSEAHLQADINAANEVPPNGSAATGVGQCLIDTNTNTLFYHVDYSGLSAAETAAHIHGFAPPGVNAGVLIALPASNPKIGAWSYAEAQEANILAGQTYFNIHTTAFPGGEVRGQIVIDPDTDMIALINAAAEVPPNASPAQGIAVFDLDTTANTLNYEIRYGNLTSAEIAAHIHGFAPPGTNAGVLVGLAGPSPKIGVWNYAEGQEADLVAGLAYVNIHTSNFPGGEIRGQIVGPSPATDASILPSASAELGLVAAPNPVREGTMALFYRSPADGHVNVQILDVTGRVVRSVYDADGRATGILAWDTRDEAGVPVASGVYFARITTEAGEAATERVVVLR
jgi:Cu/Zn superoxide dismutase